MEELNGLQYFTALSYAAIDKADMPQNEKRDLLASMYAALGLIDDGEFLRPSDILYRYELCFKMPIGSGSEIAKGLRSGDVTEGGAVYIEDGKEKFFKYDVGSSLWSTLKETLPLSAQVLPKVLSAYELADRVTDLGGTPLKAMWFLYFPFIMGRVAFDRARYDRLRAKLQREAVFDEVLNSRYAGLVFDDIHEAEVKGLDPAVIEWYRPYIEYKLSAGSDGKIRAVAVIQKKLAGRQFEAAALESERLLSVFPNDGDILLLHIAARTQSLEGKSREERAELLRDTLEVIDTAAGAFPDKAVHLSYYRGLTLLGLGEVELAKEEFETCLALDPTFEAAMLMLKGMASFDQTRNGGVYDV